MYLDKINLHLLFVCGLFGTAPLWAVELKEAEITALKNIVEHDTGEGKGAAPAHASEKIFEKSKLSTAAASMAELTFADSSITRVGANTSFSFQSKERLVKLDKGTVLINTPPGAGGATVECGGVTAAVTGTTFMASVDGNGNKMFVLLEGTEGMRITAGGKTTMVRAGQAASVGGGEGGGKKEDSGGGSGEKKAGGDQPAGDKKESGGDTAGGGDKPTAGGPSAGPDAKGGGDKPTAGGPTPKADQAGSGGTGGGGERKALAPPTVQVFDVDVKKVVASTPLIQAFDKPLPSAQKIQATVEVQQAKMSEGKMESLGVEIVAVKADGDVLVGAPKVAAEAPAKKEEPKADAPAKKEDVVAKKEEGGAGKKEEGGGKPEPKADAKMAGGPAPDNLDISTAAGPGAGAPPAPSGTSVAAATPPPPPKAPSILPPPVNIGQIVNQRPQELAPIVLTVRANDASRAFGAPNPDFGFSITAGGLLAGHSVVTDLRTTANNFSEVSGGPFGITFEGLRILDGSGGNVTSRYDLTKVPGALTIFRAEQEVNFALPSNLTFGTEAGLVAGVRGGEVSFAVVSGPAAIEGGRLVATSGTGSVVVRASTRGNDNYLEADATRTINLAKAEQRLLWVGRGNLTFGTEEVLVAGAAGGEVSFAVVSGPAAIEGGRLVATSGTGSVVVRASTLGDDNYLGADLTRTINLAKAGQSLDFELPKSLTFGTEAGLVAGVLGGEVSFAVVSGPAAIEGGRLVATSGTGSVVVRASTRGNDNYLEAAATRTINLAKAGQSVSFTLPGSLTFGADTGLSATKLDSAQVSFEVVSGPATIENGRLVATSGTGSVVVKALTPGDGNYLGANAEQTITLAKAGQSVSFTLPGSLTFGADTGLSATKLDSAQVSFEVVSGPATIDANGKLVATSGTGSVVVKAVTPGDANYRGAEAQQTITLAKAGQALNFEIGPAPTFLTGSTRSIPVVMGGSTAVSFLIKESDGRASLASGSLVIGKIYGANSFTIEASATEDGNYVGAQKELVIGITPDLQAIVQSNPLRSLVELDNLAERNALDNYFYFESAVAGSSGALAEYFVDAPMLVELGNSQKVELGTSGQYYDFFAAQATKLTQNLDLASMPLTESRGQVFFYATRQELGLAGAEFFGAASLGGDSTMSYDNSFMDLWEGSWADWRSVGGAVEGGVDFILPYGKETVGIVAGTGGISIQGVTVNANGAALEVLTSGNLRVQAADFKELSGERKTSFEAVGVVQMGATTEELAAIPTTAGKEAMSERTQVRIEATGTTSQASIGPASLSTGPSPSSGIAVIRSGQGLEMRDVVIRGFGGVELQKGFEVNAPRVLVSGSSVRDFKIKELTGAMVNADAKIQMAVLDATGELGETMVVQNGLPVSRQLAGVLDQATPDSLKNILVDAQTVSLAAKRLEFQNASIAAMSAITARANTVLLHNSSLTVLAQNGMINFYTREGLVNRTYVSGTTSDNGMLNFSGVNSFRIGNNSFTVQDQATLNQHYGNNIVDTQFNGNRPEAGKVNVLKM